MRRSIVVAVVFVLIIASQSASATPIPLWVKDVAKLWADGLITDKEFLNAIEYLVEKGYILIEEKSEEKEFSISPSMSTSKLLEKGVQNLKEEDNEIAILYFNEALKREPDNVKALVDKGIAIARTGNLDEAKFIFDQAIKLGEKKNNLDYRAVINAGIAVSIYGNQTDAIHYFDTVLANAAKVDENTLYAAYVNKGIAYFEQQKYEEAIEMYDKALEINPGRLGAIVNKANALQEMKRYGEALSYFEQAHKITSDPLRWRPTFIIVE
ncbi:MAG: tetratricopeptide repeat protein [Candidatus Nitrosotenuis sp.]